MLTIWVCNFLVKGFWRKSCSLNIGEIDTRSTTISADMLVHIVGCSFCTEHHILGTFCSNAVPIKNIKYYWRKSCSTLAPNMLVKLTIDCIIGREWKRYRMDCFGALKHYNTHAVPSLPNLFHACPKKQGTLKWQVSLYPWPPVWLVWNQLFDNGRFLFLFAKRTDPNQQNRRSTVQWYFPFSIPWKKQPHLCLLKSS